MTRARTFRAVAALFALVALAALGGCAIAFRVHKTVTNSASTGPFTVHVTCTNGVDPPSSEDLVFDTFVAGQQTKTSLGVDTESALICDITEPVRAGAVTVTMSCVTPPVGVVCTPSPGSLHITVAADTDTTLDVSVTNDFAALPAVPGPVTNVVARLGSVIVSWTPPANPGSSAITGYVITQLPGGTHFSAAATATSIELPCPPAGTYAYALQAQNAVGLGTPANSNSLVVPATCGAVAVVAAPSFTG